MPLVDFALGAALVSLRQQFPFPPEKITDEHMDAALKVVRKGAKFGMQLAMKIAIEQSNMFEAALRKR